MSDERAAEIEQRLAADEWLRPGDVGTLFGKSRWAVNYWIKQGKIGYRLSPGGHRELDPADVRALLAEARKKRRDSHDDTSGGTATDPRRPAAAPVQPPSTPTDQD